MATIQILGTGGSKCGYLAANAERAAHESGRNFVRNGSQYEIQSAWCSPGTH